MAEPVFTQYTVDDLTEQGVAYHSNLLPEDDVSRKSDLWIRLRVLSLLLTDVNFNVGIGIRDALPDTAVGLALDRWGAILEELRRDATAGRGTDALRLRGTVGAAYDTTMTLTHASGLQYRLNESGTIPGAGFVDIDVVSVSTGSATLLEVGQVLVFDTPPVNIEQNAALVADIDQDGLDAELDGPYRERVLLALRRPGLGGTASDWQRWALAVTGVAKAFVYPNRDGLGTVDIAALHEGSGDNRALDAGERTDLGDYIDTQRPIVAVSRILETIAQEADAKVVVTPMPSQAFAADWTRGGVAYTVSTWTIGTRVLKLSAARPVSLAVGHRISVNIGTGAEVVVEALGPAADEVTLRAPVPTTFAPVGGEAVYPGGPLVEPIRAAITAWIDQLGPVLGDYGTGWKGSLYAGDLSFLAQTEEGVLDSSLQTLAGAAFATIAPTEYLYPDDDQIGYLKPGRLLVVYSNV